MSRMMDNLARVETEEENSSPQPVYLKLVRPGVVPSPSAGAPKAKPLRDQKKIIRSAMAAGLVMAITIVSFYHFSSSFENSPTAQISPADESIALLKEGNFPAAELNLRSQLKKNPNLRSNRINLGYALKAQNKFSQAEIEYLEALRLNGPDPVAFNNLGALYILSGHNAKAERMLTQAVDIKPDYADARLNLARAYENLDRIPDAIKQYRLYMDQIDSSSPILNQMKERTRLLHSLQAGTKAGGEKL